MGYRDNYPPGTSFRVDRDEAVLTCPACEETTVIESEYDHSVGSGEYLDGTPTCRGCGREFTAKELGDADWGPPEPDPDADHDLNR